jgi:hypothetical protein
MNLQGEQLVIDFAALAAERAADHADAITTDWSERAFQAFRQHARTHRQFSTEDVIAGAPYLPAPPDKRAWGHIAKKANKLGICTTGYIGRSTLPHAHGRWITIWNSNIYQGAAH